ncbi:hypothetical protein ACKWTF_008520 [Chironomus riparius]
MKTHFFILIALIVAIASAQNSQFEPNCEDELLRFGIHPENCARFYMCMLNTPVWFDCAEGQIFEQSIRACVPGDSSTCVAF